MHVPEYHGKRPAEPLLLAATPIWDREAFGCRRCRVARDVRRDAHLDAPYEGFAGRMEVSSGPTGRRRWPEEVRARIIAESYAPGARVAEVARAHGTTCGQIYDWRRLARDGLLALPAPVGPAPSFAAVVLEEPPPVARSARKPCGAAVVEIVVGDVVIRAPRGADEELLARAIRAARMAGP